jgi:hypothetical protein
MAILGELIVKIVGDSTELNQAIDSSEKKISDAGKNLQNLGGQLTTFVTLPILGLGTAFTKAAIDAEETENKFSVVFRDILEESEAAANNLSENFGLSSLAAKTLLSDTGDLLTGFGFTQESALDLSNQVNELAVDLASFTNFSGGAEGASAILTKALLGEREALKSLGIAITEADLKSFAEEQGLVFEEITRQEKAWLTYQLAVQQSGNAIDDFERSQDSAANQIRILQANAEDLAVEFGEALVPAVTDVVSGISEALKFFTDLDEGSQSLILTMAGLAAAAGPVIAGIGALQTAVTGLSASVGALVGPIGLVVASFTALVAISETLRVAEEFDMAAGHLAKAADSGKDIAREIGFIKNQTQLTNEEILNIIEGNEELKQLYIEQGNELKDINQNLIRRVGLESGLQAALDAWNALNPVIEENTELTNENTESTEIVNEVLEKQNSILNESARLLQQREEIAISTQKKILSSETKLKDNLIQARKDVEEENELSLGRSLEASQIYYEELNTATDEWAVRSEELVNQVGDTFVGAIGSSFEAVGRALVEGGNAFEAFGDIAKGVLITVLKAIGDEALARALFHTAAAFVDPTGANAAAAAAFFVASAAAYTAAGAASSINTSGGGGGEVDTSAGTLGDFEKSEVLDDLVRKEEIVDDDIDGPDRFDPFGGLEGRQIILNVEGTQMSAYITTASENGQIQVDPRSIRQR